MAKKQTAGFDDLGFEESFDDMGFTPEGASETAPPEIGKLESFQKGTEQGLTLGGADEIQGGIGASMDAGQALLNKLGLMDPSPSQVGEKLAAEGFKGDVGPQSVLEAYQQSRDSARKDYKNAEEANPMSSFAGNMTGGSLLFGGAGKLLSPLAAAKDASLSTKALTAAGNAMRPGALAGLGLSEADLTEGQVAPAIEDTANGMALGGGISAALPIGGAGLSKGKQAAGQLIEDKLPSVARAYEKGKQGINTASETFMDTTNEKLGALTGKLKEYTLAARNHFNKQNDEAIEALNTQINGVQDDIHHEMNLTKKLQSGINEGEKTKLELQKIDLSNKIQGKVQDAKSAIGATYDNIENQLADKNVKFRVNDEIAQLAEDLQIQGLAPEEADRMINPLKQYFVQGDLDLPTLKQLKLRLVKQMESMNPGIRTAFKRAYGRVNDSQIKSIEAAELPEVAKSLKNANQKFMTVLDLEDNFIGKLQADRILKDNLANKEAINTLNNATKGDAKNMNDTQEFLRKLNTLDPNMSQQLTPDIEALAQKSQQVNNFSPAPGAPSDDMMANQNRLQQLQDQLSQLKKGPEVKNQMDALMKGDEKQINDYLGKNLKNVNNPIMEPERQNMENVLESYKKAKGVDLKKDAQELIKDTELIKSGKKEMTATISPRGLKFGESALQGPVNKAGLAANKVKSAKKLLEKGVQGLSDADEAVMTSLTNKMKQISPEGAEFARVLGETLGKNSVSKNAIIFGLMQQPKFRELFHQANEAGLKDGQ